MATLHPSTSPTVRVLGVDPGTRIAGYGVLDVTTGRPPRLVAHGAIRFPPSPLAARLEGLFRELRALIAEHSPAVMAIERVFHGKNFQSILKVGEARGVAVLAAQLAGLRVHEYTPAAIKKAATGNGNAAKAQVQRMMGRLLAMNGLPEPADASDALAAAFCHVQRAWRPAVASSTPRPRPAPALPRATRGAGSARARPRRAALPGGLDLAALIASGKARLIRRGRAAPDATHPSR